VQAFAQSSELTFEGAVLRNWARSGNGYSPAKTAQSGYHV
jgi:hypothetical protein